ncbi:radical SAM/SPASM domain-containing protein [uncultured Thiothrix sp.]|uniref:radical SAM/SPASM domain-containing protein n=1 Tax=uncultured Thiothrix sp. TaxID=223185 RepID=UPI00260B6FC6|nr:radical SAM/SPASM domain-containing protein [uncultured Thiothrix sp.]
MQFLRFLKIKPSHFKTLANLEAAKSLFKHSVNLVEIEVFSYCNRTCWFCPNSFIDRRSANIYMPEALYLSILEQLAEIEFDGKISYSRYNEPLADKIILERIKQARNLLPKAHLHTNTNGDYLNNAYLHELKAAGLNSLNIQIYLANNEHYDHEKMRKTMLKVQERLGLSGSIVKEKQGEWLEAEFDFEGLTIRQYARNFDINGCSRGDTLPIFQDYQRTAPCFSPFEHLYIDYNGNVIPCCNIRSDIEQHQKAIVGDLESDLNIFQIYAGKELSQWRKGLVSFSKKGGLCANCRFNVVKPSLANRLGSRYAQHLI